MKRFCRHAAAVILACPTPKTTRCGTSTNFRILMAKRSRKSSVMPGMLSFPGGEVDEEADFDPHWSTLYLRNVFGLKPSLWNSYLTALESSINRLPAFKTFAPKTMEISPDSYACQENTIKAWTPAEWAFKIAAIRELFEECGILIYRSISQNSNDAQINILNIGEQSTDEAKSFERDRKLVHQDPKHFLKMCNERKILPAFWLLKDWSNWLTPCAFPARVRFNSVFYILTLKEIFGDITVDNIELESADWIVPSDALNLSKKHEMKFAPPQQYELGRLANFDSLHALDLFAADRQRFGMDQICVVLAKCADGVQLVILPGDDLYPKSLDVSLCDVPIEVFKKTSEQLRSEAKKLHRLELPAGLVEKAFDFGIPIVNIKLARQHVAPKRFI